MRKSLVALLLVGAVASSANLALAASYDDVNSGAEGLKLMNAQMARELSRAPADSEPRPAPPTPSGSATRRAR